MGLFDLLFGCDHTWFSFNGMWGAFTWTQGDNGPRFSITAQVCLKCKKVEWKFIDGKLNAVEPIRLVK